MRSELKSCLIKLVVIIGVLAILPTYVSIDVLLHRNENYVEKGYDADLINRMFSTSNTQDAGNDPDLIEVFPAGEMIHTRYPYSRKGYINHGIHPIKTITEPAEIRELNAQFLRLPYPYDYVPLGLEETAIARYDIFFQFETGVGGASIYQIGNRFCMDNCISAWFWISNEIVEALGIPRVQEEK